MNVLTLPRSVAAIEYKALRLPATLLQTQVVVRFLEQDSKLRLGLEKALGALDEKAGTRLWEYRIEADGPLPAAHDKHNLASPSPVTDGELVFAWFGTGQIVALNRDGKLVWARHLGKEIAPFEINWGHSSSPTLHGNLLLLLCDHAPASYLLAVDKETGKQVWRVGVLEGLGLGELGEGGGDRG